MSNISLLGIKDAGFESVFLLDGGHHTAFSSHFLCVTFALTKHVL